MRTELGLLCLLSHASLLCGLRIPSDPAPPGLKKPNARSGAAEKGLKKPNASSGPAEEAPPTREARCPKEGDYPCDTNVTRKMAERGGLVISGQGGSATRAAFEIIEAVGTHASDCVDKHTKDAWAVRDAHLLEKHLYWVGRDGTVAFDVGRVKEDEKQSARMCEAFMRLARSTAKFSTKPWMVKEPWLRLLLPFVDAAVGASSYKLVHVTRDVRFITATHGDEHLYDSMRGIVKLADRLMQSGRSGGSKLWNAPGEWHGALFNASDLRASLNATKYSRPAVEKTRVRALPADVPAGGIMDIEAYTKFAYMWGVLELELHRWWLASRPKQYFHLSENMMLDPLSSAATARRLGVFLGASELSDAAVQRMLAAYDKNRLFHAKAHASIVDDIIKHPNMQVVREAMRVFGYWK